MAQRSYSQDGDKFTLNVDIGPNALKAAHKGTRQLILHQDQFTVINSEGKELVVEVKIATKQYARQPKAPGYGRTNRPLVDQQTGKADMNYDR